MRLASSLLTYARAWLPGRTTVDARERLRAVGGAALGLLVTALLCRWMAGALGHNAVWLIAPLGASAVLVFAVPASPLAQPWSVIGGNTLSALVGIACANWIPDPAWAAAVAVGGAIGLMFAARCLHPPGGAAALLAVLTHTTHFSSALFPFLTNSVLLVLDLHPERRGMASSLQAVIGSTANGVVAGAIAPLVMHSTLALALTSTLMLVIGLVAWVWLHDRWPDIGRGVATEG